MGQGVDYHMDRDELISEMNAYYDRRAPWHDEYMSFHSKEDHEKLMRPLIETLKPKITGKAVIEVACGTGIWTQTLAGFARLVVAADVNDSVINIARSREYGETPVRFEVVDAYALDQISGTFDVVYMADWWSHIPKQRVADFIQTLHRHLEKGACVIIVDMLWREAFEQEEVQVDADGNRCGKRVLPDGSEFWVVKNFPDETELRSTVSPYARNIEHFRFDELERWMVMYSKRG